MLVIGRGLIAQSLRRHAQQRSDTVAFAAGVGDSTCVEGSAYARERELLAAALEQCRKAGQRLVYCSTATHVHGAVVGKRSESTPAAPQSPYGVHKCLCEELIRESGCSYLIVRLANLVGPRQNAKQLVPQLIRQLLAGHVRVHQHATRDLLDVADLARILDEVLGNCPAREVLVVASGISIPVVKIVEQLQEVLHTDAEVFLEDRGDAQSFDVTRMRTLAPHSTQFNMDYPRETLRRYAAVLAEDKRVNES